MLKEHDYDVINKVPMTRFHGPMGSQLFLVHTPEEWRAFFDLLMTKKFVACDTETSGFRYYDRDRIVGMSFGWGNMHFYVPVRHQDSVLSGPQPPQLNMDDIRKDLQEFFSRKDLTVAFHNAIFDRLFYRADGIEINVKKVHDTLIMWKLGYDEDAPAALKTIASGWVDKMQRFHKGIVGPEANKKEKELVKWRVSEASARRKEYNAFISNKAKELRHELEFQGMNLTQIKAALKNKLEHPYANASVEDVHYGYIPIPLMVEYAATDTFLTVKVFEKVVNHGQLAGLTKELYEHELELSEALMDIQSHGLRIDRKYLQEKSVEYEGIIAEKKKEIAAELGDINISSPAQLAQALIDRGIKLTKLTETGAYSVDAKVLNKLAAKHDIVKKIIDLRKHEKIKSTYFDSLVKLADKDDVVRTSFKQNVVTGRLSLSEPNLSNQPRGPAVRTAFLNWSDEYLYVFADYSQVEVRLLAHFSEEPALLRAYRDGLDIHLSVYCNTYNIPYDEAIVWLNDESHPRHKEVKEGRTRSKIKTFGVMYGIGAPGLAEQIPRPEHLMHLTEREWIDNCQTQIDDFFNAHLYVKRFVNRSQRHVRKHGYIVNPYGRIRRLPHVNAVKLTGKEEFKWMEGKAARQGPNFLIQGTAGDIFKRSVVRIHKLFKGRKSAICNLIHDDINMFIHKDEIHLLPEIKHLMEDYKLNVPLEVDMEYSTTNWAEKKKFDPCNLDTLVF